MYICIESGEARSDHKRSLEMHVETYVNARCELTDLSTCVWMSTGSRSGNHLF